jgi:nucleotide-binding universal stress UspA family protein
MFNKIVVGTDGSTHGDKAVRAAIEIASGNPDADLNVVMAYHPMSARELSETKQMLPEDFRAILHAHYPAEETLERAKKRAETSGISVTVHEIDDDPTEALVTVAEKIGADLIVVGSRRETLAGRMMHGSVSTKVLHHAPCSLLVVT